MTRNTIMQELPKKEFNFVHATEIPNSFKGGGNSIIGVKEIVTGFSVE